MTDFKKMALLPANFLEQLQAATSAQPPPPTVRQTPAEHQLSRLDGEMKRILDDTSVPDEVKVKLYGHALHQFNQIHSNTSKPVPIEVVERPRLGGSTPDFLLRHVPERKSENATAMVSFLKEHPEIGWNDRGELLNKGDAIRGSNITDIFNYAVREMKHEPHGWTDFYDQLTSANVPVIAIGNSIVRKRMGRRAASPPGSPSPPPPAARAPTAPPAPAAAATPPHGTPPATRRHARVFTPTAKPSKAPATRRPNQTGKGRRAKKTHVMRFVGLYK